MLLWKEEEEEDSEWVSEWPPLHWSRGQIGSEEEQEDKEKDKEKGRQKEVKGTIDSNGHPHSPLGVLI